MKRKFETSFYINNKGGFPVEDFLNKISRRAVQKFLYKDELLKTFGLTLKEPHCKHIKEDIYELRFKGGEGQIRVFYFSFINKTFVCLHGFVKKSQKMPKKEFKIAVSRKNDILEVHNDKN